MRQKKINLDLPGFNWIAGVFTWILVGLLQESFKLEVLIFKSHSLCSCRMAKIWRQKNGIEAWNSFSLFQVCDVCHVSFVQLRGALGQRDLSIYGRAVSRARGLTA